MQENGINWWKTPADSADLNPIENVWHQLKHFLRSEKKPKTKAELLDGIGEFWANVVTVELCNKYIDHMTKVVPLVITAGGAQSGH